jgi:hydrogenase/urease accessory protein HupE
MEMRIKTGEMARGCEIVHADRHTDSFLWGVVHSLSGLEQRLCREM